MVIWLLGISGSGKTTIGSWVVDKLKSDNNLETFLIDGDLVRSFFDGDLGYETKDRRTNIKRIMLAAHVLEQNGIVPVVCNISPFQDLRNLCRSKFGNYLEIYLNKSLQTSIKNDVKGLYKNNENLLVGRDLKFDIPESPDLVIDTDNETVDESRNNTYSFILRELNSA